MEKIEVRYSPLAGGKYYHKYIVYTDSNGNQFGARGGPSAGGGGVGASSTAEGSGSSESSTSGSSGSTGDSPFGNIRTDQGPYDPNFPDYDHEGDDPSETIIEGTDLSDYWQKIKDAMDAIGQEGHPYRPVSQNSNTTVDEALRRSGLPEPEQDGFGSDTWSPGSGNDLPPPGNSLWDKIKDTVSDWFSDAQQFFPRRDPLTFDLDGDGLETVGINPAHRIFFDHDADGVKTATGWIAADDGLLVLDRSGNGTIDDGTELFGDSTPVYDANGNVIRKAEDGFAALAQEDTNADGKVDANDARFANLRIWQDLNQDGLSQSNELFTLTEKGVVSISVAKIENSTLLPNGNVIADLGTYTRADGSLGGLGTTAQLGDVDLNENTFFSRFTDPVPLTTDARALPNLIGSGQVRDLREAASLSPALASLVAAFAQAATKGEQLALLDGLVKAWSDTSLMPTTGSGAYAGHPLTIVFEGLTTGSPAYQAALARLTILEHFNGRTFRQVPAGNGPATVTVFGGARGLLDQSYAELKNSIYDGLLLQTRLKPHLNAIGHTADAADNAILDFSATAAIFNARFAEAPGEAVRDLLDMQRIVGTYFTGTGWDGYAQLRDWLATVVTSSDATLHPALVAALADFGYGGLRTDGNGTAGAEAVIGSSSGDVLSGAGGNDLVLGGVGDDTLNGGGGNDILYGGAGSDAYVFNLGGAVDTIVETHGRTGVDVLEFGPGIFEGDITITRSDDALVFAHGNGRDRVSVANWFDSLVDSEHQLDEVHLAEGRSFDLSTLQIGTSGAETLSGTTSNDILIGNAGHDVLIGAAGNDWLDGGTGADEMSGGDGDDLYVVDNSGDAVIEDADGGVDAVHARAGATLAANVENLRLVGAAHISGTGNALSNEMIGNEGDNSLFGLHGDDTLIGNGGNDLLDGGMGTDVMAGGTGNDTYVVDTLADTVTELAGQGTDTVQTGLAYTLGANLENLVLSGDALVDGTGNELNNVITGNSVDNTLSGFGGDDTLNGGAGADTILGGFGNDTYVLDSSGDLVIENAGEGSDLVQASINYTLTDHVENLTLIGDALQGIGNVLDNVVIGNAADNMLSGLEGNDTLDGKAGSDTLIGGTGNDTYVIDSTADVMVENADEGIDTVQSSITFALGENFENLTLIGAAAINAIGNAYDNVLIGNGNGNVLDGGVGADLMAGGGGDDTYLLDHVGDAVVEQGGQGTDAVLSPFDYTLTANVENLVLTGGALTGTGNALNNLIVGTSAQNTLAGLDGDDTLDGGAGADALIGGQGNDTYIADTLLDSLVEFTNEGIDTVRTGLTWTLADNFENLTLTGADAVDGTGNELNNVLLGNSASNVLVGFGGNDTLNAGSGADTMLGGTGNDTYLVDDFDDLVVENMSEGTDVVQSGITYTLTDNVENLTLMGSAAIDGTGNTLDNVIVGNSGANTLSGLEGNDTYLVNNTDDVVIENADEGTDSVESGLTYTLSANVENLTMTGGNAIDGTGNALANVIIGNGADNVLDGGAGVDSMSGGGGNDIYVVDNAGDIVSEAVSGGTDLVLSSVSFTLGANVENLTLTGIGNINGNGNALNNIILGNVGSNLLDGGLGSDFLSGGLGDDTYVVEEAGDLIIEGEFEGMDLVESSITYALTANVENLTLAGSADIHGTGNALDNIITGNSGANLIDGGLGADSMAGGAGDDTYVVENLADAVTENAGEGIDTVRSSLSYALGDHVENLVLTGSADLNGTGNALANSLTGNSGGNLLDGAGGVDTMAGGGGGDTYIVDDSADVISESIDAGSDTVLASATYTLSDNIENLTLAGAGDIDGTGNALANTITANSGLNVLAGLGGDDTYLVDGTDDVVVEAFNQGIDEVRSSATYALSANVENLTLTGTADIDGAGNALDNLITGTGGSNLLEGGGGDDTLIGGDGDDTLIGGDGDDLLDGGLGADTMSGNAGNDTYVVDNIGDAVIENFGEGLDLVQSSISYSLTDDVENLSLTGAANIDGTGNALNNIISGNSGNNLIDGAGGADAMSGGAGDDTYLVENIGDTVTEGLNAGADLVLSSVSFTLTDHIENLTLTGAANINGTGNALNNIILGNVGNNVIDGAAGADHMTGGAGNDTYVVDAAGDLVSESSGEGTDLVQSSISYALTEHVENLTLTGAANVDGTGNAQDNIIAGNSGANVLDGGLGADTMAGGAGNDTYVVESAGDLVSENSSEGTDLVQSSISYTLTDNVENLTLTGTADIDGTGNELANIITGNGGLNTLTGLGGDDTYVVQNSADVVVENAAEGVDLVQSSATHTLSDNVENLTLTGAANIDGTGNTQNNVIVGNSGSNVLDGGAGADTMAGGHGDDTYIVDNAGDLVSESAGAGTDLVQSSVSYTLTANVENLWLTGAANINGTGNVLNNIILGNVGNNVIDGGLGADAMAGGAGDDTYVVQSAGDSVTENLGEGTDLVQASISYTLTANVEHLTLTDTGNIDGTGNALDNLMLGNAGNNVLDGAVGSDSMAGGAGNDTYVVDDDGDRVTETLSAGTDRVQSSITYRLTANVENLTLTGTTAINGTGNTLANIIIGNSGSNVLDGDAGADTISGGAGNDTLFGGGDDDLLDGGLGADAMFGNAGNDTYVVDDVGDSVTENLNEGTDSVQSSITYTLTDNVENLTLTGTANIDGTGNALNNIIVGNVGNNLLDGAAGADSMSGGAGNDIYVVENPGDLVIEGLNAGTDLVRSSISYALTNNVEDLTLTGAANIDGTGNALNNIILGNVAHNVIDGGLGTDAMAGSAGNDTYVVESGGDSVTENLGEGTDLVQSSISYTLTANVENLALTGNANINGTGNALDNIITGNSGNNGIDGAAGADSMAGGAGNDTYVVESAGDLVTENLNEGTDLVQSSITYTLGANVENLTLTGAANIDGTGNALNNIILGNVGNNLLDGAAGADTMSGGAGNDTYFVDSTGDLVIEAPGGGIDTVNSSVTYALSANVENLTLTGDATIDATGNELDNILIGNSRDNRLFGLGGNDTLIGNAGNDLLDGGTGADALTGNSGDDTYVVDHLGDLVTENLNEGTDLVQASISYTLTANVEHLTLTDTGNIDGTGNALDNLMLGNAGNNVLDGAVGSDSMAGGAGNDTYVVDDDGDRVTETLSAGTDRVQSSITYRLTANVENLTLTGAAAINGTGNTLANIIIGNSGSNVLDGDAGADTISGGAGNDTLFGGGDDDLLDGGLGADLMFGNAGNDTYVVDSTGDAAQENLNEGTDSVQSSITYTLAANVENLTLTGTANINGTGNALNNIIVGNVGNNLLDGAAGADSMSGGAGNDIYVVENPGDLVIEGLNAGTDLVRSSISYTLTSNVEELTLTGAANIDGTGNALNNIILGNVGNNVLDGAAGADSMAGSAGNDTYVVENASDLVTEFLGEGTDLVQSSISYTLGANVENLLLTGTANINGTGNALNNSILGNVGNNVLDGAAGADSMAGGAGNDTYVVESTGDLVTENLNEGTDLVQSSITYTLTANVENLTLTGTANFDGTGNALANIITGNSGDNQLSGLGGDDTLAGGLGADAMFGGQGNDTYLVDNADDLVTENLSEGTDLVQSSISYALTLNVENLTLTGTANIDGTGNSRANVITGNSGNNLIDGGAGADNLSGGLGNDTYIVENLGDTVTEALNAGTDLVLSSVSFTLGVNLENLTLTDIGNINGTGNTLSNVLTGNDANNQLFGLAGNDTLVGGGGNDLLDGGIGTDAMSGGADDDTYVVADAGDLVVENLSEGTDLVQSSINYTLSANVENLTLTGTADLDGIGNALANVLTGNQGSDLLVGLGGRDTLIGNLGNDILDGGLDADAMFGGAGNDAYFVDDTADTVIENLNEGQDIVLSSSSYALSLNVEDLALLGAADVNGTGNAQDNVILGNAGNNVLDGAAGADSMTGGAGNDTYVVESTGDLVVENLNEGTDLVRSSISYTLGANVENLTLTGTANINGTGNALANIIVGNFGDNVLDGAAGEDSMAGLMGNDTYVVDNASDVVTELLDQGTDLVQSSVSHTLRANVENLTLTGAADLNGTGNALDNILIGNTGNNQLFGLAGNDTLVGAGGNDLLDGGTGIDAMSGGAGNDTYVVDNAGDVIAENAVEGTDLVQSSISYTLSANVENLTLTGTANINGTGNALANIVVGNFGDNVLDGAAGEDSMAGLMGNDTYVVDNASDVVTELLDEGTDLVQSSVSHTLSANVENLTLTGAADLNGTGNALDNILIGNSGSNQLFGLAGNDTLVGAGGNDLLDGGTGTDAMSGGAGNDTYEVDNADDLVMENLNEGTDLVQSSISYTLASNVENLTLSGAADLNGTGNALNNILTGNSGNNQLFGLAGNDTLIGNSGNDLLDGGLDADAMSGGAGNDTFVVNNAMDLVTENLNEGTDLVQSSINFSLTTNVENLTLTGTANLRGTGNSLANVVTGNDADNELFGLSGNDTLVGAGGNDLLNGGLGADSLSGGLGDDTYDIDNVGDIATEGVNAGTDFVFSTVSFTLGANLEHLTLTGPADLSGTGNALNNILAGLSGNNQLFGLAGTDTLTGNSGNDLLDGGLDADAMSGGADNDTYVVDNVDDLVTENLSEGTDLVQSSINYTLGANVENLTLTGVVDLNGTGNSLANLITGNDANNQLFGLAGNDTLLGVGGSDLLDGGIGSDAMSGGAGDDTYIVDDVGDVVIENFSQGTDTVFSAASHTLATNVENLTLTGSGSINGTGNILSNALTGNDANNQLFGLDGNDTLAGGGGNDLLDGGLGTDSLSGGQGNDTYVVDNGGDLVSESSGEGTDLVQSSISYTLSANVENLTLTGTANLFGTGNTLNNVLTGNEGNNVLFGLEGNDTLLGAGGSDRLDGGIGADAMNGGAGDDIYFVDDTGDTTIENLNEGTDLVRSGVSYALTANVENLMLAGSAHIVGTGNSLANVITGNNGNNVLDGGAGADSLSGGLGNDTYVVDDSGDTVTEELGFGIDLVQSSISYALTANVENLTLTGNANLTGTGNTLSNVLTGNEGNNVLFGLEGNDTLLGAGGNDQLDGGVGTDAMAGGAGDDVYLVDETGDTVIENLNEGRDLVQSNVSHTLSAHVEDLMLLGTADLNGTGNALDNILTGNSGNNLLFGLAGGDTLIGNSGNDLLDGGLDADAMSGGAGNDTYVIDHADDLVTENLNEGTDLVQSGISYTLTANVENLGLTGAANINGTGNSLANAIAGNSGNNVLDGGAGTDNLSGGAGNDTYIVENLGDTVTEGFNAGTDLVLSSVSFTLGANLENLTLTDIGNINGTGNILSNVLLGNEANNQLFGLEENDILVGGGGNDLLDGGLGIDSMSGGQGDDTYIVDITGEVVTEQLDEGTDLVQSSVSHTLSANVENLTLTGTLDLHGTGNVLNNILIGNSGSNQLFGLAGGDTLIGNLGNDLLDGGLDADAMSGGQGNDSYVVDNADDLVVEHLSEGTDLVQSGISYALTSNVENLTLTGTANINGTGNALANLIIGNSGANLLAGLGGNDTYVVDQVGDVVVENAAEGVDLVQSSISYALTADVENLTLTGTANIDGTGNAQANVITGNSGDNLLDGGVGGDTLIGGAGNDTYLVDSESDSLVEDAGGGTDLVLASASCALSGNIENLTLVGGASINGTGNDLANLITGNSGNNMLAGGGGNDQLSGGAGDDTYVFNLGDGIDTIHDVSVPLASNRILFGIGITRADLSFSQEGNVLTIHVGAGGDALILPNFNFSNVGGTVVAATVEFADGSTASLAELANRTPVVVAPIADQNATEDAAFSFVLPAGVFTDPDVGDPLTWSATRSDGSALPDWLTFDAATRTLSGTPRNADVGNLSVLITATDAHGLSASDVFTVSVANTNDAPTLANAIADQSATEDSPFSFVLPANTFEDVDAGDTLTYAAVNALDGSALPAWLSFDAATRTFSGTPLNGDVGSVSVRVTATDGSNTSASDVFLIAVANTNDAPTVANAIADQNGQADVAFAFTVPANTFADADLGDSLVYGATRANGSALPSWLSFNAATRTFSGTPGIGDTGVLDVRVTATDSGGLGASDVFSLNVILQGTITGTPGNDTLIGTPGRDLILGLGGNDTLIGLASDDTLDGGTGADAMIGGAGNDTYLVDNVADVVTENVDAGIDTVMSALTWTLGANLENLTLTGTAALNGTGNTLDNVLTGNGGNNTLTGGAGNDTLIGGGGTDTLIGGTGNDSYTVDSAGDVVAENASEGTDTVNSSITYTLGANLDNLTLIGGSAINGTGNSLNNVITGNSANNVLSGGGGNDILDGGAGADTMAGGTGNDTYFVDHVGDVVTEIENQGNDTVNSVISWTLGNHLGVLNLIGGAAINGTGNSLDNTITGNAAGNVLDGGAGVDKLIGGAGNDSYVVDNTGDVVTENAGEGTDLVSSSVSYTLLNNIENLTLTGAWDINGTGNTLDNVLTGNTGNNTLIGAAGNDTLNGAAGNDTLKGGSGDDLYIVDSTSDIVTENAGEGTDTVSSSVTLTLSANVENLLLTGSANRNGTGNTLNNLLTGNTGINVLTGAAGNDTLDGAAGNDTLIGGTGNDTYLLGRGYGADLIQENDATPGNTDIGQFLSGITADQIWFQRSGSNLVVSIIGTSDQFTVQSWYSGSQFHVEQFRTADGHTLLDTQVQNLVNAMAGFAPPAPGQTTLSQTYADALNPVIAANWR